MPLLFVAALPLFFACTNKNQSNALPVRQDAEMEHVRRISRWQYFQTNADGSVVLKPAAAVTEIPAVAFCPWTEAVRVADSCIVHAPLFLINKCGLYSLDELKSERQLPVRHDLFKRTTAGTVYCIGTQYFIRIYQNSVFLPDSSADNEHFLLRADTNTGFYMPAAVVRRLQLPATAQCKILDYANGNWYASFKADSGAGISFFYVKCKDFSGFTRDDAFMHIEHISAEDFRAACEPVSYRSMPQILKELADTIENQSALYIRVFTKDQTHGAVFSKPAAIRNGTADLDSISEGYTLEGHALYYMREGDKHTAAILLPDGTLAFNTSELGTHTIRLPALPRNGKYTSFFLSDTQITAAWEESTFYQVGRSGFFTARLDELLR